MLLEARLVQECESGSGRCRMANTQATESIEPGGAAGHAETKYVVCLHGCEIYRGGAAQVPHHPTESVHR